MGSVIFFEEEIDGRFKVMSQVSRYSGAKVSCRICRQKIVNNQHMVVMYNYAYRDTFYFHTKCADKLLLLLQKAIDSTDMSVKAPEGYIRIDHSTGKEV